MNARWEARSCGKLKLDAKALLTQIEGGSRGPLSTCTLGGPEEVRLAGFTLLPPNPPQDFNGGMFQKACEV